MVPEDSPTGSTVFTCTVTDEDSASAPSGQHSFFITGGNVDNKFNLDNETCDLTLVDGLDFERLSRYDVTITATDLDPAAPRSASMVISIQVDDVNEEPNFVNVTSLPVTVPEDSPTGSTIFTCTVTDEDSASSPSGQHSFSITGGNVGNKFNLDNETCDLTLADGLDFERLSHYDVTIKATDLDPAAPHSASMVISIQVDDVNEEPKFVNVTSLPVMVPEDSLTGSTVFTCTVTDEDSASMPSGQHSFFITGGNVGNKFNLDNETCDLTLADGLDFERLSRYDVTITATDLDPVDPHSVTMVISIQVDDVNENPTFTNLPGEPVLVREDVAVGTEIFTCSARDPDQVSLPRDQLIYDIVGGNEAAMFDLDPITCKVNVSRSLDFEAVSAYHLTLTAEDLDPEGTLAASESLVILVVDVNEHTPTFVNGPSSPSVIGELSGIGSTVVTCTASDLDSASQPSGQLRYQITEGNDEGRFTLQNESVCLVAVAQALDYETQDFYALTLTVQDLDPNVTFSATQTFQISVTDENDPPVLHHTATMPTVQENSAAGTFVFDCSATDQDDASLLSGQLRYSLVAGNENGAFALKTPCRIETTRPLDTEAQAFHDLVIQVTDLDPADPKTNTLVYRTKVTDVNDNTPYFLEVPEMPISVPEDTPLGVPFLNCSGDDDDTPLELTGHVRYEITAGNEENFFTVDPDSCNMSLLQALDFENKTLTFNITVRIYDLDPVAPRSVEQVYRICVTNVNDNAPRLVTRLPSLTRLTENAPLGTHIGRCSAEDDDTPLHHPSAHVRYKITRGNPLSLFYLDPYTCDLYVHGLLDFEQKKAHVLKVVAFDLDPDRPLQSEVMSVRVRLMDDNDNGPTCQSTIMMTEMSEDTKRKTEVMTLDCSDLDRGRASSSLRFQAVNESQTLRVAKITGRVRLMRVLDWDDVSEPREHELVVEVRDNAAEPHQRHHHRPRPSHRRRRHQTGVRDAGLRGQRERESPARVHRAETVGHRLGCPQHPGFHCPVRSPDHGLHVLP
ncbi:cadherin-23-like [Babylonia areolata]|uniref:cadherin-23-like n=1 Tax=Babylonia areolata TaxID=304850 RepID=UPI003FCF351E